MDNLNAAPPQQQQQFSSYLPSFSQVIGLPGNTPPVVAANTVSNCSNCSSPLLSSPPSMTNCGNNNSHNSGQCGCRRSKTPPAPKKKSWSELKGVVSELRRQIMALSTMVPTNVNFRTLADGRVRVYFLSTPPNGFESTLLYTDVNPNAPQSCMTSSTCSSSSDISTASSEAAAGSGKSSPPLHQQLLNGSLSQLASSFNAATTTLSTFVGESTQNMFNESLTAASTTLSTFGETFNESLNAATNSLSTFGESVMNAAVGLSNSDPDLPEPGPRQQLRWNQLLEPTISGLNNNNAAGSREVQLLLERKRLSTWGITSFELHKESGKIVYPASSTLYQCLDTGFTKGPIFPAELRLSPLWAAFDPQICPQNSDLVAYVCGGDIWVAHTVSGHVERLTFAHDGRRSFAEDSLSAGVPSYVILEEFNRYQGFWWQPHSDDHIYRIAYEEVDESDVGLFTFPTSVTSSGEDYEEYRFPRAGTPNAKSKLKLVQFRLSESLHIEDVCIKDLHCPLSYAFPWMEYLVRVGWTPDSKFVWAQLLNRLQQRLDIILIPLDNFTEHYSSPTNSPTPGNSGGGCGGIGSLGTARVRDVDTWPQLERRRRYTPIQVIYSQLSETWVNVHNILQFLELTDTSCTFVWASEETEFRHLYLITSALHLDATQTQLESNILKNHLVESNAAAAATGIAMDQEMDGSHGIGSSGKDLLTANVINKVALTDGKWEVCGQKVWIDKVRQLIYFQGLKHSPLEKQLYAVSLQQPCNTRSLTKPGSSYTVHFNDDCSIFMQTFCNIHSLPTCEIMKVDQTCDLGGVNGLHLSSLGYLLKGGAPENFQYCPTIYTEQLRTEEGSETIYAMVFKPHNFRLGVKYPTVLNVYGGPEVQVVNNTFKGIRQMRMHMLAAQGYCVVCIDSRGSHHRGVKFEGYLRKRMGTVELADQVEILQKLSNQLGYIDMSRVAIHGWSYGGYLSLMGLVQHPDVFKVAIAGAPVTSWENYDTAYTERYMDLPQNNPAGYNAGSVLSYVNKFPEEENRLLIIHGLIDENVHFYHTSQLVNALVRLNKPYQLQVYPTERHSLRNLEASKHYETTLLSFLQNHL